MAFSFKEIKFKFLELIPLLLLFFISLNGNSVIDFKFFSINVHYILIYYWVLKRPQALGYGFIFLAGIITDGRTLTFGGAFVSDTFSLFIKTLVYVLSNFSFLYNLSPT